MERAKGNVNELAVLECRNVGRSFESYEKNGEMNEVLRGVDFEVKENEFLVLFGAGQCGKTTLLNILAGLDKPTTGEVYTRGQLVTGPAPERGVVYQKTSLFPWLTVEENVGFGPSVRHLPKQEQQERVRRYLELVGLTGFEKSFPSQLSGGMRQRVGIAMAMIFSPKILLADEPTSALDVTTQAQIIRQIVDIRNEYKVAVIIVTHNIGVASYVSNKIMVMQGGRVVEYGKREDVIGNPQHEYTKQLLRAVPIIGGKCYYA